MKFSYQWLQELSGTERTPEALVELLTMHAFEVEELEHVGFESQAVVVGEVVSLEPHPNADKLRVAQVNIGTETLGIVCGAPNIALGQKVPVALVGAVLPGGFEIKEATLRGVESSGMICSEKELGLGENHEGIMVLSTTARPGMLLEDLLGGTDTLLDIKVLPDRAHDALSHVGMAREIAVLEGHELDFDYAGLHLDFTHRPVDYFVAVEARGRSQRYIGVHVSGISVGESPLWLQTRLKTFGMRPINVIVDITNYVMLELGQPLHAFDWERISGEREKRIVVRQAGVDESVTLLDGKEYLLSENDLVIADAKQSLALAGIMGGLDSAVTVETTDILLEAAQFDPVTIRRTRSRLGLRTDASDRFEKGLSPEFPERAMARAVEMLTHLMPEARVAVLQSYPEPQPLQEFTFDPDSVERLLGIPIEPTRMAQILRLLGFEIFEEETHWVVQVPAWRLDIDGAADLAEEIGRVLGYDSVSSLAPMVELQASSKNPERVLVRTALDTLATLGFTEVYNYSFYGERDAESARLDRAPHLELTNPMSPDQMLMRTSLLPRLLHNTAENLKHFPAVSLVENGRVYARESESVTTETKRLAGIVTGESAEQAFFSLKQSLQTLFGCLDISAEWLAPEMPSALWHPTRVATVSALRDGRRESLGTAGIIHPSVTEAFGLKHRHVAAFDLSLATLIDALPEIARFHPFRRFPVISRDIAFYIIPSGLSAASIEDGLHKVGGSLLLETSVFDRYTESSEPGQPRTSLALRLTFGADNRTLETIEVDSLMANIVEYLEQTLNVEIRR